MLKLNDGRRLLVPREELGELKDATPEQAVDLVVGPNGVDVWWPPLDDGLYLPDFSSIDGVASGVGSRLRLEQRVGSGEFLTC